MGASLESEVDDAPDQFVVPDSGGASGTGISTGALRQITVGVHVYHVRRAVGGQANIEAPVVA